MTQMTRVAAAQFHIGNDVDANLATCLRIIAAAGERQPQLLVLPEFCNHCSWYDSAEHCYDVSVDLDGAFMQQIAAATAAIGAYLVINCTVRRAENVVTGTSILLGPDGHRLGTTDKQVLIGHENDFLRPAEIAGPIIDTPFGQVAMYSCMDGVINETPRCLALRGADILCNSLNSFAIDEGSLHIPVRAAENKVWVVAANKVGPLIPEEILAPVSAAINIPADKLAGAGDSQIVAPDGTVVALAGKDEAIIHADIDPQQARDKQRPDGTDLFASRRPALYRALGDDPAQQEIPIAVGADVMAAAVAIDAASHDVPAAVQAALAAGASIVALPTLTVAAADQPTLLAAIAAELSGDQRVACGLRDRERNTLRTVLLGSDGLQLAQTPLHASERHGTALGDSLQHADTAFGRLAVIAADDAIYPETLRLAALAGVSTAIVCGDFQEEWETQTGLVERSAENRINLIAAASSPQDCLIASLQNDFTIMTEWQEREFDGLLSAPEVRRLQSGSQLLGPLRPEAANNKECSRNTHLVASRPWQLLQPITT